MEQKGLNFREHIKPLFIADTIFTLGIAALIMIWMFGDDKTFLGGFFHDQKALIIGVGLGLSLAGSFLLARSIRNLVSARKNAG